MATTFGVQVTADQETKINEVMQSYTMNGDKKADTLLRIMDIAKREAVKGTHPHLQEGLNAVEKTISILMTQINGLVVGSDAQIEDLKESLNRSIEEKRMALEEAEKLTSEAKKQTEEAEEKVRTADESARMAIERAQVEREQAIREKDVAEQRAKEMEKYVNEVEKRCNAEMQAALTAKDLEIAVLKTRLEASEQRLVDLKGM